MMHDLAAGLGLLEHGRPLGAFDHMDGSATDHGTTRRTGGQLRQGHSHGHRHFLTRYSRLPRPSGASRLLALFPCHYTDQKSFKGQVRYSPVRVRFWDSRAADRGGTRTGSVCRGVWHASALVGKFGFRDSGVENRLRRGGSSISRSPRNFIMKNIITTKCQSLAASGGTDYRRSRPSGGGSEDAVQKCRADGPFGRVVWRRCLIA